MTRDRHDFVSLTSTSSNWTHAARTSKRTRHDIDDDDDAEVHDDGSHVNVRDRLPAHTSRTDPYYVAGYSPFDPIPSTNFPHQDTSLKKQRTTKQHFQATDISDRSINLQQQHAAVITSILHLSLQRGDYAHAGQALSLLLRSGTNSTNAVNLRANGTWAIGAEILLRGRQRVDRSQQQRQKYQHIVVPDFAAAKAFYEQLILQYPHSRQRPSAIDARTFYPALFGLMIYETTFRSSAALQSLSEPVRQRRRRRSSRMGSPSSSSSVVEDDSGDRSDGSDHSDIGADASEYAEARLNIKGAELDSARSIARRMDELLISPPYDRAVPLLRLRGMVGLWTADLLDATGRSARGATSDDENEGRTDHLDPDGDLAAIDRRRARDRFRTVIELGGEIDRSVLENIGL